MSGRLLSLPSAPKDYKAGSVGTAYTRIEKAVNELYRSIGLIERDLDRTRLALTQRESVFAQANLTPFGEVVWNEYDNVGTAMAQAVVYFTQGWNRISIVRYRFSPVASGGNVDDSIPWIDSNDVSSEMIYVVDTTGNYPSGGYWRLRTPMPRIEKGYKNYSFTIQIQALDPSSAIWLNASKGFDPDKDAELDSFALSVGNWDEASGTWEVFASGSADLDTGSVYFGAQLNTPFDPDIELDPLDFSEASVNFATTNKDFNSLSLGTFSPSTELVPATVFVIGRAWTEINQGGDAQGLPYARQRIDIPFDPFDADLIDPGEITASKLEDSTKRASVKIFGRHKPGFEHTIVQYRGQIEYPGDLLPYLLNVDGSSFGDLDPNTDDVLYYVFFDPYTWAGEGSGTPATHLQLTTSETIAGLVSGKRLLVGTIRTTGAVPERAYYVFTGDQPAISAPFIYASKLSALSADLGTITAGQAHFQNGLNSMWVNPLSNLGVLAIGPTAGGIANAPFHVDSDGTTTVTSLVATGYGQIQRQAGPAGPSTRADGTVLETGDVWIDSSDAERIYVYDSGWQESLTGIPAGNITAGLLTSANWNATLGSQISLTNGTIYMGGSAAPKFSWDGSNLSIAGNISMTGASSLASSVLTISGDGRIEIGSGNPMAFGYDVDGGTNDGLWLNANNYWYTTGDDFKVGGSDDYMVWNGSKLSIFANSVEVFDSTGAGTFKNANVTDLTISGTLTMGVSGVITNTSGELYIDNNEFVFGDSSANTVSTISLGIISTQNTTTFQTALMHTGGFNVTSGGNPITTSLTSEAITSNNDLALWVSGTLYFDGVSWPGNTGSGDFGKFLKYDSLGVAVWATPAGGGSGTVTSIGTGEGLQGGTITTSGTIDLDISGASVGSDSDFKDGVFLYETVGGNIRKISGTNVLVASDGLSTTIKETQIQTIGGGNSDQWRERTLTFTDGQLVSAGTFSTWTDIISI